MITNHQSPITLALLLVILLSFFGCIKEPLDGISPHEDSQSDQSGMILSPTTGENLALLNQIDPEIYVENDRLVFPNDEAIDVFIDVLDNIFENWVEDTTISDTIHGFTHEAVFALENYLGYSSLQGTYTDDFYAMMDFEDSIQSGMMYISDHSFSCVLNEYGEYQVADQAYIHVSADEWVTTQSSDIATIGALRDGTLPLALDLDVFSTTRTTTVGGANKTATTCEVLLVRNSESYTVTNFNPYEVLYTGKAYAFSPAAPAFYQNGSVPGAILTVDFGDGSQLFSGGMSGGTLNIYDLEYRNRYLAGVYTLDITANCDPNEQRPTSDDELCVELCDEGLTPFSQQIEITDPGCRPKTGKKIEHVFKTINGKEYALAATNEVYLINSAGGRHRTGFFMRTRFYRKNNSGNWKQYKCDDDIEVSFTADFVYQTQASLTAAVACGTNRLSASGSDQKTKKKDICVTVRSAPNAPFERFAADAAMPSLIESQHLIKHKGQTFSKTIQHSFSL